MIRRPHTATLQSASQTPTGAGKTVAVKSLAAGVALPCFVQPITPDAAYQQIGLQLAQPYRIFCDLLVNNVDIVTAAPVGSQIAWNGITLIVQTVRPYRYNSSLDHATIYCEEKQR
jgi:hypothetical protein